MSERGDLRGLSSVIATLLIILLTIVAVVIIWLILRSVIINQSEFVDTQKSFFAEKVDITYIKMNETSVSISLKKMGGNINIKDAGANETVEIVESDIISVVDLSGSMRSCNGISSDCCNTLRGNYGSGNCSSIKLVDENICVSCGGEWVDRLTAAQDANKELINMLSEARGSRIGLVGYNTSVVSSAGLGLTDDINQLNNKIDSWQSGGSTCICCGINEAMNKLRQQSSSDRAKKIIVMSDGEANVECLAQRTHNPMQDAIKSACDAKANLNNLIIYSIGVGGNVNEQTLVGVANCGGGKYFFTMDIAQLIDIYKRVVGEIRATPNSTSEFTYLIIVFYNGTASYREKIQTIPNVLVIKNYNFDLTGKLEGDIQKIEVYPAVVTKSGREIIGPLLDTWKAK